MYRLKFEKFSAFQSPNLTKMSQSYHEILLPKHLNFNVYFKLKAKHLVNKVNVLEHEECSSQLKLKHYLELLEN